MNGKGSLDRTADRKAFRRGWDRIFGPLSHLENGTLVAVYRDGHFPVKIMAVKNGKLVRRRRG